MLKSVSVQTFELPGGIRLNNDYMLAVANLIFCYLRPNVSFSAHIMQGVTVLVLVFMWCTQTVHAQEG